MELETISRAQYKRILEDLLEKLSFQMPTRTRDPSLEKFAVEQALDLDLPHERMAKIAKTATNAIEWTYPYLTEDARRSVTLYTVYFFGMDDMNGSFPNACREFTTRLVLHRPQGCKLLQSWADNLADLSNQFGTFAFDMIFKSTLEAVSATVVETERGHILQPTVDTPGFHVYFRDRTGVTDAYIYMIFGAPECSEERLHEYLPLMPDLAKYTNQLNDLFSFYKESIVGEERNNAIYLLVRTSQISVTAALLQVQQEIIYTVQRMERVLESNPVLKKHAQAYIYGYIAYHLDDPRYRLSELSIR